MFTDQESPPPKQMMHSSTKKNWKSKPSSLPNLYQILEQNPQQKQINTFLSPNTNSKEKNKLIVKKQNELNKVAQQTISSDASHSYLLTNFTSFYQEKKSILTNESLLSTNAFSSLKQFNSHRQPKQISTDLQQQPYFTQQNQNILMQKCMKKSPQIKLNMNQQSIQSSEPSGFKDYLQSYQDTSIINNNLNGNVNGGNTVMNNTNQIFSQDESLSKSSIFQLRNKSLPSILTHHNKNGKGKMMKLLDRQVFDQFKFYQKKTKYCTHEAISPRIKTNSIQEQQSIHYTSCVDKQKQLQVIQTLQNIIHEIQEDLQKQGESANILPQLIRICEETVHLKHVPLYLQSSFMVCTLAEEQGDHDIAIQQWRDSIKYCNYYQCYVYKLIAYKHLINIFQLQFKIDKAIVYCKKMLKYSWLYRETEFELMAYEYLSKIYFYDGSIEDAKFFHERAIYHRAEDLKSPIRMQGEIMCLQEQELNRKRLQDNTLDVDNFDLEIFQNAEFLNENKEGGGVGDSSSKCASERQLLPNELEQIWNDCQYNSQGKKVKKQYVYLTENQKVNINKKKFRIDKFKVTDEFNKYSILGLVEVKNKLQKPLGAVFANNKQPLYRTDIINPFEAIVKQQLNGVKKLNVNIQSDCKSISQVFLQHLSANRNIKSLIFRPNRKDDKLNFIANNSLYLQSTIAILIKLLNYFLQQLNNFKASLLTQSQSGNSVLLVPNNNNNFTLKALN